MNILYWVFYGLSVFGIIAMSSSLLALIAHFFKEQIPQHVTQSVSVIVPIKGADKNTEANLKALVNSELETPVEFLFALETKDDPAYIICKSVKDSTLDKDIHVILTGESNELMGKQHNINFAMQKSKYDIIASMDADVIVRPESLREGLEALNTSEIGIVYFLPYYDGSGSIGGSLLMTYINNFYNIIFSYLHFYAKAPAIIGALWIMPKELLIKCGANGRLSGTVSDDRELGFAISELGLKNYFMPRTVKMPHENLSFIEGIKHLGKWFGMVRAEGILVYIIFLFLWNPLLCSIISLLIALSTNDEYIAWSLILILSIIIFRIIGNISLNKLIYKIPLFSSALMSISYDAVLFPVLFLLNLFKTTIEWKEKKYRLGKHGKIL